MTADDEAKPMTRTELATADTYDRLAHPRYPVYRSSIIAEAKLGDEVALQDDAILAPVGLVTAIYPEAVEVSTGDDYKVADLVLLRRGPSGLGYRL